MKDSPSANLLLVCQGFKAEYEQQFGRAPTLVFRDLGGTIKPPTVKVDVGNFARVELHLLIDCNDASACNEGNCATVFQLDHHWDEWMSMIQPMLRKHRQVDISVYFSQGICSAESVEWPLQGDQHGISEALDEFALEFQPKSIQLYSVQVDPTKPLTATELDTTYNRHGGAFVWWTEETGWQKQ